MCFVVGEEERERKGGKEEKGTATVIHGWIPRSPRRIQSKQANWALLPHSRLSPPPFPIHFLSLQDDYGWVALHRACHEGHLECAKALLGAGADINKQNNNGWTPLIQAAISGRIEVVRELLKQGANINKQAKYGDTPLMYAAKHRHIEVVTELLKHGANKALKNKYGKTAYDRTFNEEIKALLR